MGKCVKCSESQYVDSQQNHCLQKGVAFLSCEDPLGLILIPVAQVFLYSTVFVLCVFKKHQNAPNAKANNQALTYILLITLTSCLLCPLLFIGHPNTDIFILQQSTFGPRFNVAHSTFLAKRLTIVLQVTVLGRMKKFIVISRACNLVISICTHIKLFFCEIWLTTSLCIESDSQFDLGHIVIVYNMGTVVAFNCVLGYLCFLAIRKYFLALLSRILPDTFSEAKYTSLSLPSSLHYWVIVLSVFHSTKGKVMVTMEFFSFFPSVLGSLAAFLSPDATFFFLFSLGFIVEFIGKISVKKQLDSQNLNKTLNFYLVVMVIALVITKKVESKLLPKQNLFCQNSLTAQGRKHCRY